MLRAIVLAVLVAYAGPALAQGILPSTINTARISRASPAHYVTISAPYMVPTATPYILQRVAYPFAGNARLVNVVMTQVAAGTGGTSWSLDIKNSAGTSLMTTLGVATLASGAYKSTDAMNYVALPSGWTRPVLKTDTTVTVSAGTYLEVIYNETGTYSPRPSIVVTLVFEPLQ